MRLVRTRNGLTLNGSYPDVDCSLLIQFFSLYRQLAAINREYVIPINYDDVQKVEQVLD